MEHRYREEAHPSRRALTPFLRRVISEFYWTTLDDYREAGCPFGSSVEAMLLWYEFGQATRSN